MKVFLNKVLWQVYDKFCFRLIWEKFIPPSDYKNIRKPSSLFLWMLGIYFTAYGIVTTIYESRINKIENHANFIIAQLGSVNYKKALEMIPEVQNRKCPREPFLFDPISIFSMYFLGVLTHFFFV